MKKSYIFAVIASSMFATGCNGGGSNNTPPVNGLTTSFSDGSNSFNATTETPSVTKIMTLSNTGESNISQISFILPSNNYFSVTQDSTGLSPCVVESQSITNTLLPNKDCTIKITYNNATVTPSSSANIVFNYSYAMESKNQTTPVTYVTTSNVVPSNKVKYVAVGDHGSISYTTDGTIWSKVDNKSITGNITAVIAGSNGFVAVGENYGYYSTDGKIWSKSIVSNNANVRLHSIAYGNGYYVAVGSPESYETNVTYRSVDGKTWSKDAFAQKDYLDLSSIIFSNGKFITVGSSGYVCSSEFASNWNCGYVPKIGVNDRPDLKVITSGNNGFMIISKYGQVYTSTDAVLWLPQSDLNDLFNIPNTEFKNLAYGNSIYAANAIYLLNTGYTLTFSGNPQMWSFNSLALQDLKNFATLSFNGVEFIAIQNGDNHYGLDFGAVVYTSQDGITFTAQSLIDKYINYNAIANKVN